MNHNRPMNIQEKYESGFSDLREEQVLFQSEQLDNAGMEKWFRFRNKYRKSAPAHLKENIWEAIERDEKKKRFVRLRMISVAASILLFLATPLYWNYSKQLKQKKKEMRWQEAMAMFPKEENNFVDKNILYEDKTVVIYLASE